MKPPILCLALLVSAVSVRAQVQRDAPAPAPKVVRDPCRFNTKPASYEADSKECRFLLDLEKLVEKLTAAADFKSGEIPLSQTVDSHTEYNAAFGNVVFLGFTVYRMIVVTDGFVRCHRDDPESAADVIAHEVGHAVQSRGDIHLDWRKPRDMRRQEAQADALASEILLRAGLTPHPSRAVDLATACIGWKTNYETEPIHPGLPTRWVEGVLQRERTEEDARAYEAEKRQLAEAHRRSERMKSMLAAGAPWPTTTMSDDPVIKAWDNVLRRNDWKRISDDGRFDGAVRGVIKTDVPQPFTADRSGRIRLPGGKMWLPPPGLLRYLSPAEIIAYATRGPIPPETIQEGFKRGLEYLMQTQDWSKLPGKVTDE